MLACVVAPPLLCQDKFAGRDLGNGQMELREGGNPALVHNYGPQVKEGAPENKRRCCYIFPVYTPGGPSFLDDFPYNGKRAAPRITPDEKNPGAPQQWRLRNYGLVGAWFPGRTEKADRYALQPGKPPTLKFQVRVSDLPRSAVQLAERRRNC